MPRLIFLLFSLLLIACGGPPAKDGDSPEDTHQPTDTDPGPPPTAREYCEATVEAFCGYYVRCGRMVAEDIETCRTNFLETCTERYLPHYVALEDAELLQLSADGVEACAAHLETVECSQQIFDLDGGCAGVWEGLSAVDGACAPGIESFVCAEGSTCVLDLSLCGSCQPTVPVGADCTDARCEPTAACVEGSCVARSLPGEACDPLPCVPGASCTDGICQAPTIVSVGEACDARNRCPYKSACIGGSCVETGLLGEPCGAQLPCASGWCDAGVCAPFKEAGEPCDHPSQCVFGTCDGHCGEVPGACFDTEPI